MVPVQISAKLSTTVKLLTSGMVKVHSWWLRTLYDEGQYFWNLKHLDANGVETFLITVRDLNTNGACMNCFKKTMICSSRKIGLSFEG